MLLGIEIGGTKLQVGLGTESGGLIALERRIVVPEREASTILGSIAEAVETLLSASNVSRSQVKGVGIGFGGPVDPLLGLVVESHQIRGWTGFKLCEWVKQQLGFHQVILQNDADTAGLGEALMGSGRGFSPVFYVTIGSGIGGGLIVDGQIYRGNGSGAIEIGHLWVYLRGELPKKLEHLASGWAIGRRAQERLLNTLEFSTLQDQEGGIGAITGAAVGDAAIAGDALALDIIAQARNAMIQALGHSITLLAPQRIILGGGVSLLPVSLWLNPIREGLDEWVFPQFRSKFSVVSAELGEAVVIHGALVLAAQAARSNM